MTPAREYHIIGGGMAGAAWYWVVTTGRYPNRRTIAQGEATSLDAARRDAERAMAEA